MTVKNKRCRHRTHEDRTDCTLSSWWNIRTNSYGHTLACSDSTGEVTPKLIDSRLIETHVVTKVRFGFLGTNGVHSLDGRWNADCTLRNFRRYVLARSKISGPVKVFDKALKVVDFINWAQELSLQDKTRSLAVMNVHLQNKVARLSWREGEVWEISAYMVFNIVDSKLQWNTFVRVMNEWFRQDARNEECRNVFCKSMQ
jgi:hypothetical protein